MKEDFKNFIFGFFISLPLAWLSNFKIELSLFQFNYLEKPLSISLLNLIQFIPNFLGLNFCSLVSKRGDTAGCGFAFGAISNYLIIFELAIIGGLIFYTSSKFSKIFISKFAKKLTPYLILIIFFIILLLPYFYYGNIYSENNDKPKLAYCFDNKYPDRYSVPNGTSPDLNFDDCVRDSLYYVISRSSGITSEKDYFDKDNVINYCYKIKDEPLPSKIQNLSYVLDDTRKIDFDGYKFISKRDFCFISFASFNWGEGEFALFANESSKKSICDSTFVDDKKRDYCIYYLTIKNIVSNEEKQKLCSEIYGDSLRNQCLTIFNFQGTFQSTQPMDVDLKKFVERPLKISELNKEGLVTVLLNKTILEEDTSREIYNGSAFWDFNIETSESDELISFYYNFLEKGYGDQLGIWLDDKIKFIFTGSNTLNEHSIGLIDLGDLSAGMHIMTVALHAHSNGTQEIPSRVEVWNFTIYSKQIV